MYLPSSRPPLPTAPLPSLLLGLILLGACSCGGDTAEPGNDENPGKVTSFMVKGVARDLAGKPLANVKVDAYDSLEDFSRVSARTDAQGAYSIRLDPKRITQYYIVANMNVTWDGQQWNLPLDPSSRDPFPADEGATINLTWKLSGPAPGGQFGSEVFVSPNLVDEALSFENVEVDFVPSGPLIDGSEGQPFTVKLGESFYNHDVPLGRYTVTARYTTDPSVQLKLRPYEDDTAPYTASLESGFRSEGHRGTLYLAVSDAD